MSSSSSYFEKINNNPTPLALSLSWLWKKFIVIAPLALFLFNSFHSLLYIENVDFVGCNKLISASGGGVDIRNCSLSGVGGNNETLSSGVEKKKEEEEQLSPTSLFCFCFCFVHICFSSASIFFFEIQSYTF